MKKLIFLLLLPSLALAQDFKHRYFHYDQHCYNAQGPCSIGVSGSTTDAIKDIFFSDGTGRASFSWSANEPYFKTVTNAPLYFGTNNLVRWYFSAGGDFAQDATNGGNIVMSKSGTSLLMGATSYHSDLQAAVASPSLKVVQASNSGIFHYGANSSGGPLISFAKSRATDGSADVVVSNDDYLGEIDWRASDGASYRLAAFITARVDGSPGSSDMPGRIEFYTTPDGSATPAEALRLTSRQETLVKGVAVASLPATCTAGALMRATDSDNCTSSGGNGALCVCNNAGTGWTLAVNY